MKTYEYILKIQDRASAALKSVSGASDKARRYLENATKSADRASSAFGSLSRTIVAAFSVAAITSFGHEVMATTAKVESLKNAINFASGGVDIGGKNFEFIRKQAEALGLPLQASMEGFLSLAGATKGTQMQGQKTIEVFNGVSIAASAMQLSSEQTQGALLAIGQIMSKGKVQAEELRGQLGERLPGAFQIAARAMGLTTQQLDKLMSTGGLSAMEFLPRFAKQLQKEFSGALPESTKSLTANINRFNNQMLITKYVLGTELLPTITKGLTIATVLTQRFTEWIGKNQDTLRKWWGWIKTLGTAFLTWKAIGLASIVMLKSFTIATTAAKMATILFTGGFKALSVAMRLNPFGFIITAIQLLAAGFVIAYDKIDGFRGAISAIGGVFTAVGEAIVATFLNPLKSAVEAWQHFKNFEFGKAALSAGKGILQFQYMMPRLIANSHSIARERWDKDYEKGVNSNFKISDWIVDIAGNLLGMPKIGAAADSLNSTTGSSDFSADGNQDISSGLDSISSGGRSVKNVTVNIENLWKGDIKVDSRHTRMELRELERTIKEVLLRAIGGAEQAMG